MGAMTIRLGSARPLIEKGENSAWVERVIMNNLDDSAHAFDSAAHLPRGERFRRTLLEQRLVQLKQIPCRRDF
jgi:hypothetical protein